MFVVIFNILTDSLCSVANSFSSQKLEVFPAFPDKTEDLLSQLYCTYLEAEGPASTSVLILVALSWWKY